MPIPASPRAASTSRSGPGTDYAKLGALKAGEVVEVEECKGSWCFVDRQSGKDGWVAPTISSPSTSRDDADDEDVPVNFGVYRRPGRTHHFLRHRQSAARPARSPPEQRPGCFYTGVHFSGISACVAIGASSNFLIPGWDNEIESFKIIGTGTVEICRNPDFGGGCVVYSSSRSTLPASYANNVSSYQTYY